MIRAVEALNSFRWVDQESGIFCDKPQPHLLADLLLGLYGYPYHCNVPKQRRWRYVAAGKVTPMYLEFSFLIRPVISTTSFPHCRFWWTDCGFLTNGFCAFAWTAIFRHTAQVCGEWFYASTLAEMGVPGFEFHDLPERETVKGEDWGAI